MALHGTARKRAIGRALSALLPRAPYADIEEIRQIALGGRLRTLPPSVAVWLASISYIRHVHSSYDDLLGEGYDRDSARHFVVEEINDVLTRWRATRLLKADDGDDDM